MAFVFFLTSLPAHSAPNVGETQSRRSSERFNIIDWIRNQQAAVRAQDSKYGRASGSGYGPYIDITFQYLQESGGTIRQSTTLGTDTRGGGKMQFYLDDLFVQGNRWRSFNIDLGIEVFYSQTISFTKHTPTTQTIHNHKELGGGLLIRPIGRSTQDTGLALKGGYTSLEEAGLWSTSTTVQNLNGIYLGAEAKLYLLPFLGIRGDYETTLESQTIAALSGKWKMQRFRYGAFLEIYLLNLGAHLFTNELFLTASSGSVTKETTSGLGFSGALHF
ncbi:MAG: hypothetical protein IPM57_04315 [Oligoflexia bacterium]|nr:hypothetical protein [Oligoflexia bacterium]